jgi:hypothetical protein
MAQSEFVRFLRAMRDDQWLLAAYDERSLPQVLFHARGEGFDFEQADAEEVIGRLEYDLVTVGDAQPFDGSSSLWRHMWGRRYLGYLVDHVVRRYPDDRLDAVATGEGVPA